MAEKSNSRIQNRDPYEELSEEENSKFKSAPHHR